MSNLILLEPHGPGVVSLILNRPERRNALNIAMLEQFSAEVECLAADRLNRVLILRGSGPVFSAGLDLKEAADAALIERSARAIQQALRVVREKLLIFIAAVQGGAFAGGAGLMAACDIVVAAADARFGFPEARRGLLPALVIDVLKDRLREGDLRELLLAGEAIDAARAQQIGLVQRVSSPDKLLDEALAFARAVLTGGPETIRQTKALVNATHQGAGQLTGDAHLQTHLAARNSDEAREGLAAFAEKRNPKWQ